MPIDEQDGRHRGRKDEWGVVKKDTKAGRQPFGYAGGVYDAGVGLVHFGAREYDAEARRGLQKDPIGFAGGDTNLYAYVGNDPVNLIDPLGLKVQICSDKADLPYSGFLGGRHHWIKTDKLEGGQAATEEFFGLGTKVSTDFHVNRSFGPSAFCEDLFNVDEECVNEWLLSNASTGLWHPGGNLCHDVVGRVVGMCVVDTNNPVIVPNHSFLIFMKILTPLVFHQRFP